VPGGIHTLIQSRREDAGAPLRALAGRGSVDPAYWPPVGSGAVPPSDAPIGRLADGPAVPVGGLFVVSGRVPPSLRQLPGWEPHQVAGALTDLADMMVAEPGDSYGGPVLCGPPSASRTDPPSRT
jgi:putative DNA methylase